LRLSVACNFEDALIDGLAGYPVTELYGKVTADHAGGGRPSFYLPEVNRAKVERTVRKAHAAGIEFNYLMNASCMGNTEYTRHGQKKIRETLDWVAEIGCDSVTVGTIFMLQLIKRCYPTLKVRISAHRFTDPPRKAAFWQEHGADCVVLNETAFAREFSVLRAIREAVSIDLSLIVNNSCRHDCAIAGTHSSSMAHGSQKQKGIKQNFPLDYHMLFCLDYRLKDPVHFVRANWIRPEDTHLYEELGIDNFKIVERNSPTPELLRRVKAYSERRYDGNLLDLVLPFAYPEESYQSAESKAVFSLKRGIRHFVKPSQMNITRYPLLVKLGLRMGLMYPRKGPSALVLDNRKMDGFMDRFIEQGCIDVDCETCRYCHAFAEKAFTADPEYVTDVQGMFGELFDDMHAGGFWQFKLRDLVPLARKALPSPRKRA
jgi:collagenase-like PrtC family protease